jgi:hypothetical protein
MKNVTVCTDVNIKAGFVFRYMQGYICQISAKSTVERANRSCPLIEIISFYGTQLNMCLVPPLHLRTETDPVSEMSCFYSQKHRTMEIVQKPSNFPQKGILCSA